jgi:outer membrane receptor for ferrienterochelin and colicins
MLLRQIAGLFLLLVSLGASAQKTTIEVFDKSNQTALPNANVCIENLSNKSKQYKITDVQGKAELNITSKSEVAVSYLGFERKIDTIIPGQHLHIYLEQSAYQVNQVVITAQYAPVKADNSIYKVNVIDLNSITEKGATNLKDLLGTELNIRTAQDGVLGSTMSLQGLSGEHIKFLIDGVPVIGRMDGNIDLSQLNMYNVDHIEIVEGPMSVIYGSNALAGAVNIITRENKKSKLTGNIEGYYESVGTYNIGGGFSKRFKNNVISLNVARNFFSGFSLADTSRSKLWNPKRQYNTDFYYMLDKKKFKFKISAIYFNELMQDKGDLMAPYYETAFDQYFYTNRITSKLEFSSKLAEDKFLSLLGSYSYFNRIKNTWYNDLTTLNRHLTTNSSDHDTSIFDAVMFKASYSKSNEKSKLDYQSGLDVNIERGEGKRILNNEQSIGDYAVFISGKYKPIEKLSIQPGLRYSWNTKYQAPLVYSVNLKYDPAKAVNVRASYARGFRSPSLKELYLYFVDVNHDVQGNPDLQSEYSHNINLSAAYNFSKNKHYFTFEGNLFYNYIKNIITLAQKEGLVYTYINIDQFRTRGGGLSVTYKLHPRVTWKVGWECTGRYNSLTASDSNVEDYAYTNDISSEWRYSNVKYRFTISVFYKYNSRLQQFYVAPDNSVKEGYIDEYHTLDVTVKRSFFKDKLQLTVGGKNLFDNKNINSLGSTGGAHSSGNGASTPVGWGRTWFAGLTFYFNQI